MGDRRKCQTYTASPAEPGGLPAMLVASAMPLSVCPRLFWFLDAGMTNPSTRCGGRRPKSAKARSRGKLGTGGAAGAMGI